MKELVLALGIVALLAAGCADDDRDDALPTTTSVESTTTTEAPPSTTTTAARPALDDPEAVVQAWIAAIAGGDDDAAIALTSQRSLDAFGGPAGFEESETALAEGWGAWDAAEDLETFSVPLGDGAAVVVLHGDVPQEGPPQEAWAAVPVVATSAGDRVEPFLDLGEITVDPPPFTEIEPDTRFTATVPADVEVTFVVDAGLPVDPALQPSGGSQVAELDVADLDEGLHVLTVVLRAGDDVTARTFEYPVTA